MGLGGSRTIAAPQTAPHELPEGDALQKKRILVSPNPKSGSPYTHMIVVIEWRVTGSNLWAGVTNDPFNYWKDRTLTLNPKRQPLTPKTLNSSFHVIFHYHYTRTIPQNSPNILTIIASVFFTILPKFPGLKPEIHLKNLACSSIYSPNNRRQSAPCRMKVPV